MTAQQVIGEINQMPLLDRVQIMEWLAKSIREEFEKQLNFTIPVLEDKNK